MTNDQIDVVNMLAGELLTIKQAITEPILVVTRDGQYLRHGVLIEELSKDELLALVRELAQLILDR